MQTRGLDKGIGRRGVDGWWQCVRRWVLHRGLWCAGGYLWWCASGAVLGGVPIALAQTPLDTAVLSGRLHLLEEDMKRVRAEQRVLRENLEKSQFQNAKLKRRLERSLGILEETSAKLNAEQDKLEVLQQDIVRLLRSPVGALPSKSVGDKAFRKAFLRLVSGELDLAALAFAEFYQIRPQHPRAQEAVFREGQAWFLLRNHDRALKPLLRVSERQSATPWVLQGRWMLARSLEETGEWLLARTLYAQLAQGQHPFALDSAKRLAFLQKNAQVTSSPLPPPPPLPSSISPARLTPPPTRQKP